MAKRWLAVALLASLTFVGANTFTPAQADNAVSSVSLGSGSCASGDLQISITLDVAAAREAGIVTNADGTVLKSFEHASGVGTSYTGGYAYGSWPAQPAGTVIGLYGYIGQTPPSASDTVEFFVAYTCDTGNVVSVCSGAYGSCPQSAADIPAAAPEAAQGCDITIPISSTSAVGSFVTDALVYWAPGKQVAPQTTIPAGKTAWVLGVDTTGMYYEIVWSCDLLWVPTNTMGPNYDALWNGRPLPTEVVD